MPPRGGGLRWLALALALAFPAATMSALATAGGLAAQTIAAVSVAAPRYAAKPRHAAKPSADARAHIPRRYLATYKATCHGATWHTAKGRRYACWAVLAGIGKVESDHGRSSAPGVRSGVNRFGCCAGPMQFNLRNGPPSTWATYGHGSPYRPEHAIPAAKRLLLANGARTNLDAAIHSYNHSWTYVGQVKAHARRYQDRRS